MELSLAFNNESEQKEIKNTLLLREAIGEFLYQNPNSPAKRELQQALSQYDEQYAGGINSNNAGKAAYILSKVIEDLDERDATLAAFKDKAIQILYKMNSPEMMEKIREVLMLAQQSLREEEGFK